MEPSRRSDRKRSKPLKLRSEEENDSDESAPEQTPKAAKQKPSSSKSKTKSRKTKTPKTSSAPASATPKTSSAPATATATQSSSTTASKSRGKQTKKKTRTKVGRAKAFSAEQLEAARNNAEEREAHINDLVNRLDVNQCRDLLASIAREQPGIVLEMMDIVSAGDEAPGEEPPPLEEKPGEEPPPPEEETGEEPPPPARPSPRWCRCGNCHIMQTALEDQCCGYNPDECLSNALEMQGLCLDPQVLNLNMLYRADILAVRNIGQDDPRAKNRSFRHAAYRQHILWQYGRLRRGERKVIASCCVWKIRDRCPDPSGQYVPFMPGRL